MNQILPSVLSVKADGTTNYPQYRDTLAIEWWTMATLTNHSYLISDRKTTAKIASNSKNSGIDFEKRLKSVQSQT